MRKIRIFKVALVLMMLFSFASVSAALIDANGTYKYQRKYGYYWTLEGLRTGTVGFELVIGNTTNYWIAPINSVETKLTDKLLASTTSYQEVALLVLETKASGSYTFNISHDKLIKYVDGVRTDYSEDYNLYFYDGTDVVYKADSAQEINYSYRKADNTNMRASIGSFVVELNNFSSTALGSYQSIVTVGLVSQ